MVQRVPVWTSRQFYQLMLHDNSIGSIQLLQNIILSKLAFIKIVLYQSSLCVSLNPYIQTYDEGGVSPLQIVSLIFRRVISLNIGNSVVCLKLGAHAICKVYNHLSTPLIFTFWIYD